MNYNAIFLSIVIPIYNGAKVINRCLNSIWKQGLDESIYEVICVDDCSTDNTIKVIKQVQQSHSNLRLLTNSVNKRAGGSRNYGVKEATGKYVVFIDADDYYHPFALKKAIEYLLINDLDILMCDNSRGTINRVYNKMTHGYCDTRKLNGKDFFLINGFPFAPWKFIFKREIMITNHLFFRENVQVEDADWVINLGLHANIMQYQPIILVHYVLSPISVSANSRNVKNLHDIIDCANSMYSLATTIYCTHDTVSKNIIKLSNFYYSLALRALPQFYCKSSIKANNLRNIQSDIPHLNRSMAFVKHHPLLVSLCSNILSPFVYILIKLKQSFLDR